MGSRGSNDTDMRDRGSTTARGKRRRAAEDDEDEEATYSDGSGDEGVNDDTDWRERGRRARREQRGRIGKERRVSGWDGDGRGIT